MGNLRSLATLVHDEIVSLFQQFNASAIQADASSSESILNAIADHPNFKPINYGSYSVVFKYKEYPYIFKCSSYLSDGWLAFAKYTLNAPSIFLPKIYDLYTTEKMYIAITEELEPIADDFNIELKDEYVDQGIFFNACMDLSYMIQDTRWDESTASNIKEEILNSYSIDETFIEKNIEFISVMNKTLSELMKQGYTDDLHYGNVMIRDKYQIVLNDPVQ